MYPDKQTDLLETIFRVFPNASIVSMTDLKPFKQSEDTKNRNPGLAKHAKPRPAVPRACKKKVFDERQLSLFDDGRAGK
jgi:hypothetical protein